jgi:hypothetical protein
MNTNGKAVIVDEVEIWKERVKEDGVKNEDGARAWK